MKTKIWRYFLAIILVIVILNAVLVLLSEKNQESKEIKEKEFSNNSNVVIMKIPAVDNNEKGVATELYVEAKQGGGKTLVDIDSLLFWADTQQSIRVARLVARNLTIINTDKVDLIYSVKANASLIGGPSAGAALSIATIAALENKKIKDDVMITGTINHDGSIGPVSSIIEKAKASKEAGAKIFLVPLLQSRDVIYETSENCEIFGVSEICTTETKPRKVNVTEEAGIEVVEVGSIGEAMNYFFE